MIHLSRRIGVGNKGTMPPVKVKRASQQDGIRLTRWCLRQELPTFVAGSIILLLATVANVSTALLFQPLFDKGVLGQQVSILIPVMALQMALFLARGALAGFAFDLLARASARLGQNLTLRIFDHIQNHSAFVFSRPSAGAVSATPPQRRGGARSERRADIGPGDHCDTPNDRDARRHRRMGASARAPVHRRAWGRCRADLARLPPHQSGARERNRGE